MRVVSLAAAAAVLSNVLVWPVLAQAPAAPLVTVGADLKVLQFDWDPVPGATSYQLLIKPNATAPFAVYGERIPATRTFARLAVAVHTLDWTGSRYAIRACNSSGCKSSAALPVRDLMLPSIGYVKASNTDALDAFGRFFVLSQDGNTLVVSSQEDSAATGVNGDQEDDSLEESGAVYVYRRIGSAWQQSAYLKPDVTQAQQYFGTGYPLGLRPVAVTSDGATIAVGAPGENVGAAEAAGAIYLFTRAADGSWSQVAKLTAPAPNNFDYFGVGLELSDDGTYLRATAIAGVPSVTSLVYRRGASGWEYDTTLAGDFNDIWCANQLSANATKIIAVCESFTIPGTRLHTWKRSGTVWSLASTQSVPSRVDEPVALSGNAAHLALRIRTETGDVSVNSYTWTGSEWTLGQVLLQPGGLAFGFNTWGQNLAINRNGTMLAIGDYWNTSGGTGVANGLRPPNSPAPFDKEGAVFVYQRGNGTSPYALTKVVKAPNPGNGDAFGHDLALSGNGLTLAVGAPGEDSAARGIDGDQADESLQSAGAVYLY